MARCIFPGNARTPAKDAVLSYGGRMPSLVWIALGIPTVIGLALMYWAWRSWRLAWRYRGGEATRARGGEVILWGVLAVAMAALWWFGHPWLSLIPLAYMVFLPSPAARL